MASIIISWRKMLPVACGLILVAGFLLAATPSPARAAHVPAAKLLPAKTLAFVHVSSVPDLVEAFKQTNLGRMAADPQVKPVFANLFDAANDALAQFRERYGLSLEEVVRIPQGEITVALIPVDATDQIPASVAMIALIDCGDNIASGRKLVDALAKMFERYGGAGEEQTVAGVKLRVFNNARREGRKLALMEHDNTVALVTGVQVGSVSQQLLETWNKGTSDCLEQNQHFAAIMERSRGKNDEAPQISIYLDPISLMDQVAQSNPAVKAAQTFLPALGLTGLQAIGGSIVLSSEEFDAIMQFHALLDNPRTGLLDLIAPTSGDNTPPSWVPSDVAAYSSFHWNFARAFSEGTKLIDNLPFLGGSQAAQVVNEKVASTLGVDLENELLPAVTGRVLQLHWFARPIVPGRGADQCGAVQLKDPKAFAATLDKIVDYLGAQIDKKSVAGATYYQQAGERESDDLKPQPCFARLNDWLLIADRPAIMEHLLKHRDDTTERLADALDYKLIANKIARQKGGDKAGMLSFSRQEDSWKYIYDLAASEHSRDMLHKNAENNRWLKALDQGLEKSPLPPWEVINRYLAPGGAMIVDDATGLHYMNFALKRK